MNYIDSISFSGGGYNCVYHLGIVKYIFQNNHLFENTKYLGASGGAGIASFVLAFQNYDQNLQLLETVINEISKLHSLNIPFHDQVTNYINILTKHITNDIFNNNIKYKNKLHMSLTNISNILPYNQIVSNFNNYEYFINTLKASACIPFILDNQIRKINNNYYLDGGLSNNIPIINKKTVKISCLNYPFLDADLLPIKIYKLKYSFMPPKKEYIDKMIDLGYHDMKNYMKIYEKKYTVNKINLSIDNNFINKLLK